MQAMPPDRLPEIEREMAPQRAFIESGQPADGMLWGLTFDQADWMVKEIKRLRELCPRDSI